MAAMTVFMGVVLSKNAQIARQNEALQRQMSAMHVDTGRSRLENYDVDGALQSGIDALLGDTSGDLYDHRAAGRRVLRLSGAGLAQPPPLFPAHCH